MSELHCPGVSQSSRNWQIDNYTIWSKVYGHLTITPTGYVIPTSQVSWPPCCCYNKLNFSGKAVGICPSSPSWGQTLQFIPKVCSEVEVRALSSILFSEQVQILVHGNHLTSRKVVLRSIARIKIKLIIFIIEFLQKLYHSLR